MSGLAENDTVSTIGKEGRRVWLYPVWFRGRMLTWRTALHLVLIALLLVGPWIDVGGHPAMRVDITGRRIYFWGLTLFATDGAYILFALLSFVFTVFFFTALFGRAWCGWTCPQTVFLESLIRPIERLIEGDASHRRRLDRGPWTLEKVLRKVAKLAAFLVVCGAIGTTFVAYFLGREGVFEAQEDPFSHPVGTAIFISITALTFFDFAWFREQTCVVACPYGRFQSVLLDPDSLAVGYDEKRGEPRGKPKDDQAGDCVDCRRCVNVCPTGIDIRKGGQMECIQCMACIDACDDIMGRLKRPSGLIRLTSERTLAGEESRLIRPRVVVYGLLLLVVLSGFAVAVSQRADVGLNLGRQPGKPYAVLPDGRVQNSLRLRVNNRSAEKRQFSVELLAPEAGTLVTPTSPLPVEAEQTTHAPIFIFLPGENSADEAFRLRVYDEQGFEETLTIDFLRPRSETGAK